MTDAEWAIIEPLIVRRHRGRPQKDIRAHMNGILWIARSGARWEDLPARYGPHQTVYSCFCRWRDDGTLEKIFEALHEGGRSFRNKHRLNSRKSICTGKPWAKKAIRAARESFCIGTTRGGKTTKIHSLVNRIGLPVQLAITAGNVQDCSEAIPLVEQSPLKTGSNLLGDRIYGSREFRNYLTGRKILYTIPPKKNIKNP